MIARKEFAGVIKNAVSGIGLAPDVAMVTFPIDVFLPDSDLTALEGRREELYDKLMRWTPAAAKGDSAPMVSVEGKTYEEALIKANDLFLAKQWGDGLPLWPATRERVDWILRGSPWPRDRVLGKFPPRGTTTTVESCAIALAMAGGRPEYLPVLIAAVEAFLNPAAKADMLQATSASVFPVVVVNGPIARQIKLNSGFGCLGPDPVHPAGASIGRALRQMQQNLGGALPGSGTMAVWGQMRYTNAVFAEDEDGLPEGWQTHAAERHGFARGTNSVSLVFVTGATNIKRRGAGEETAEEDAIQGLHVMAGFMAIPHTHYAGGYDNGTPGVLLMSSVVARSLAQLGWDKQRIREFLWEHSKLPKEQLRKAGAPAWFKLSSSQAVRDSINLERWPITAKPGNIAIVLSGGAHSSHGFWMQAQNYSVIGAKISVPPHFESLAADTKSRPLVNGGS